MKRNMVRIDPLRVGQSLDKVLYEFNSDQYTYFHKVLFKVVALLEL